MTYKSMDRESHTPTEAALHGPSSAIPYVADDVPTRLSIVVDSCVLGVQNELRHMFGRCATVEDMGLKISAADSMVIQYAEEQGWSVILTTDMRDGNEHDMSWIARAKAEAQIHEFADTIFTQQHFGHINRITDSVRFLRTGIEQGDLGQDLSNAPMLLHVPQAVFIRDPDAGRRSEQLVRLCQTWKNDICNAGTRSPRPSYCARLTTEGIQFGTPYLNLLAHILYEYAPELILRNSPDRFNKNMARYVRDDMKTAICRVLGNEGRRSAESPPRTHYARYRPAPACA